jgi:hypothetical protein
MRGESGLAGQSIINFEHTVATTKQRNDGGWGGSKRMTVFGRG